MTTTAPARAATPPAAADAVPRGCTNLKLRQLGRVVARHYDAHVRRTGLKNTQYLLLSHVVLMGPVQPSALARTLRIDASTLSRNLQPLIAQGWVEQRPGEDARSRTLVATAAGRQLRSEGQRAWKQAQLALNERLGPQRVAALHALLDECSALLDDDGDGDGDGDGTGTDTPARSRGARAG